MQKNIPPLRSPYRYVRLLYSEKKVKQDRNLTYLMELHPEGLLFSFYTEAGLNGYLNQHLKEMNIHDGWDNPVCQIRGTFTGHWLSAAARLYQQTGNMELKARADYIVSEIGRCQEYNGNGWAFPIPEKYLYGLKAGKQFWAPQYVCHKIMMGLLDMYLFAGNEQALEIVKGCALWFIRFTDDINRETMDMMMDLEETGGIMELWGDLYEITKDPAHLALMYKYERPHLTEPVLLGRDVLTNMHANATIPEIHGCAKAYEITGDERFFRIVKNYWELAVDKRGMFATGGQTDGEVWTPLQKQAEHLSHLNQEHCTVYNMIRLADYLFRFTGDVKYLDYIERNIENGLMAQGFWEAQYQDNAMEKPEPSSGLISYFLPLAAGSRKKWGSKTRDFWCCHCTLVQANTKYREFIFYQNETEVIAAQFIPSELKTEISGQSVLIRQREADLTGECVRITDTACSLSEKPSFLRMLFDIETDSPTAFRFKIRIPWWMRGKMIIRLDEEPVNFCTENGYAVLERQWSHHTIEVTIPKAITCWPLADDKNTVAFLDGPVVLAGLVSQERTLTGDINHPETMIAPHHIRQWADWTCQYKTANQMYGFYLKPLKDIGNEEYTVYFPIRQKI